MNTGRKPFYLSPDEVDLIRRSVGFLQSELTDSLVVTRAIQVARGITQRQIGDLQKRFGPTVVEAPKKVA